MARPASVSHVTSLHSLLSCCAFSCGSCRAPQCCLRTTRTTPLLARSTPWASTRRHLGGCLSVGVDSAAYPHPCPECSRPEHIHACVCVSFPDPLPLQPVPDLPGTHLRVLDGGPPASLIFFCPKNIFRNWACVCRHPPPHLCRLFPSLVPSSFVA